jgi:hypothetical protein
MEEMTGKRARGKRATTAPSVGIGTIARALLSTALLYRKVSRAKRALAVSQATGSARRRCGKACKGRCRCKGRGRGRRCVKQRGPVRSLGAMSIGATALGALAVGAFAIGALAIRALAIKRLAIRRGSVGELDIRELKVGRLEVDELLIREETRSQPPTEPRPDRDFPA